MSYARWSNSNWYIYWDSRSGDTRGTQDLFAMHVDPPIGSETRAHWLYDDLDTEGGRKAAFAQMTANASRDKEWDVFDECVREWLAEVEEEYPMTEEADR